MKFKIFASLVILASIVLVFPVWVSILVDDPVSAVAPTPEELALELESKVIAIDIRYKPTRRDSAYQYVSYQFDLVNTNSHSAIVSYRVRFLDTEGFEIARDVDALIDLGGNQYLSVKESYPIDLDLADTFQTIQVEVIQH